MNEQNKLDKKIEEIDKKIIHIVWTIFISMITAMVVTLLATGSAGL